jgi:hypothetical protein
LSNDYSSGDHGDHYETDPPGWGEPQTATAEPPAPEAKDENPSFMTLSSRLGENLAAATLKLVDAAQDFTGLIQAYVAAGQQLERSLEIVRELANASQRALNDAREAAQSASEAAGEAKQAQLSSVELIQRSTNEHLALAELTDNLRQRIAALSVLGAPMPRKETDHEEMHESEAA